MRHACASITGSGVEFLIAMVRRMTLRLLLKLSTAHRPGFCLYREQITLLSYLTASDLLRYTGMLSWILCKGQMCTIDIAGLLGNGGSPRDAGTCAIDGMRRTSLLSGAA
jgi:hypothetical protein